MTGIDNLLGLSLGEASEKVRAAGRPAPSVIKTEPPRARHAYPPDDRWRVVRARELGPTVELVVAPPILPAEAPAC